MTGDINYRITKNDWSHFNQLNDYSYRLPAALEASRWHPVYTLFSLIIKSP